MGKMASVIGSGILSKIVCKIASGIALKILCKIDCFLVTSMELNNTGGTTSADIENSLNILRILKHAYAALLCGAIRSWLRDNHTNRL
jgi:hypothetical protein